MSVVKDQDTCTHVTLKLKHELVLDNVGQERPEKIEVDWESLVVARRYGGPERRTRGKNTCPACSANFRTDTATTDTHLWDFACAV